MRTPATSVRGSVFREIFRTHAGSRTKRDALSQPLLGYGLLGRLQRPGVEMNAIRDVQDPVSIARDLRGRRGAPSHTSYPYARSNFGQV